MKVDLTYFNKQGFRIARGSYYSPQRRIEAIWQEAETLRASGELPAYNGRYDVYIIVSCPALSPHPRLLLPPTEVKDA